MQKIGRTNEDSVMISEVLSVLELAPNPLSKRAVARSICASRELVYKTLDFLVLTGRVEATHQPYPKFYLGQPEVGDTDTRGKNLHPPAVREECRTGPRPCPWATCRYNLSGKCALDFLENPARPSGKGWTQIRKNLKLKPGQKAGEDLQLLKKFLRV